jgi:hypothetical protein
MASFHHIARFSMVSPSVTSPGSAMEVYVDNNGRQWQTNFVKMEEELEHDAEGNVIPLLREDGSAVRDPETGLPKFQPRIDPKTGKPRLRPVKQWAHRDRMR